MCLPFLVCVLVEVVVRVEGLRVLVRREVMMVVLWVTINCALCVCVSVSIM